MTREEAIKYLRQIYPNGGHCWLDEQRIEALDMAIQALSVSLPEGLDEAAETQYPVIWRKYPRDGIVRSETEYDVNAVKRNAFKAGAEWQKKKDDELLTIAYMDGVADGKAKMMEEAVEGIARIGYPFLSSNPFVDIQESKDSRCKLMRKFMDGDKVRIVILKEWEK